MSNLYAKEGLKTNQFIILEVLMEISLSFYYLDGLIISDDNIGH